MYGTEVMKKFLGAIVETANLGIEMAQDKKLSVADALLAVKKVPGIAADVISGVKQVKFLDDEYKDLTEEEMADLVLFVAEKIKLAEGKAKAVTVKSLKVFVATHDLVKEILTPAPAQEQEAPVEQPVAEQPVEAPAQDAAPQA